MLKFAAITAVILSVTNFPSAAGPAALFVAADGDDLHSGKSEQTAFATVARAREEIRTIKVAGGLPDGGITVEILGGKYCLEQSLEFSTDDSGTSNSPVIYRAYQNQSVEILGGKILKLSEFAPVTDEKILSRLDSTARGRVV